MLAPHAGYFSVFAVTTHPSVRVFAFEPIAENYGMLVRNVALNKALNVKVFNKAVAGKKGALTIYLNPADTGGHSMYKDLAESSKGRQVVATALAQIMASNKLARIDLLKLDCGEPGMRLSPTRL